MTVPFSPTAPAPSAEGCNRDCLAVFTNRDRLRRELEEVAGLPRALLESRPHLFSDAAMFVSESDVRRMGELAAAVETVVAAPGYRTAALAWAPPIAALDPGTPGAFLSYDFHLTTDGPRLIEINTNAGGALLGAALARAQDRCCPGMGRPATGLDDGEDVIFAMFQAEWQSRNGTRPLARVAIVDDDPAGQFLYPEFLLFQRLFANRGVEALVADAGELGVENGALWCRGHRVDMVYNRLVDFSLADDRHAALRAAYVEGLAVVTPHPRAHALFADKRNLALLADAAQLRAWNVAEETVGILLDRIPATEIVRPENAERLWRDRNRLFFKPATGYGSRAAYRGDKITRRVWADILAGTYVAQALVPPTERRVRLDDALVPLKCDLRAYAYRGRIQMLVARLYQGQTTNLKTPGGGLAAVFVAEGS
ncbi:MAG: hypothetical protein H3C38_11600 [Rhodospirillales bacterium]|nr:hypothetical protein [Rhodospirillales bacterium]